MHCEPPKKTTEIPNPKSAGTFSTVAKPAQALEVPRRMEVLGFGVFIPHRLKETIGGELRVYRASMRLL